MKRSPSTSAVESDLLQGELYVLDGVVFLEQDGGGERHVLVDGEGLSDGRRDVVAEVILDDTRYQHRTTPLHSHTGTQM